MPASPRKTEKGDQEADGHARLLGRRAFYGMATFEGPMLPIIRLLTTCSISMVMMKLS